MVQFGKPEASGHTVLPDMLSLIGQKLVENAEIQKFKCDILGDFQTLCNVHPPAFTFLTNQQKSLKQK